MSIKFAADQNYNQNYINNSYGAGVLNTTNWFNFGIGNGASSGVTNLPYYTCAGQKYFSGTKIVYSWNGESTHTVDADSKSNNVNLLESWINVSANCWYLSVTNLDAAFTNGYSVYFYYHGSTAGYGGQNYIRDYAGATTNTPGLGTKQWNLYTTDTFNNGSFVQDLTPANTSPSGETSGANFFIVTNLSGGAFDLLITNGNNGGINAIEIVANMVATTNTLTASGTIVASDTSVIFANRVTPAPPDGESISFKDGASVLATKTMIGGLASYTNSSLSVGSHSITAVYGGNGAYLASTSDVVMVSVAVKPTLSPAVAVPPPNVYTGMKVILLCSLYTGTLPYSFQWQVAGDGMVYTNMSGETNNQLALTGVTTNNSGSYQLVFTAAGLSVTSSVVQLMVNPPVTMNVQQAGGNLVLSWPQGLLLEATNVTGPWNTNNTPSPDTNQPKNPQMFYRVLVQ
jgi:hypothetical protein